MVLVIQYKYLRAAVNDSEWSLGLKKRTEFEVLVVGFFARGSFKRVRLASS